MAEVAIESAETMLHGSVLVLLQFDVCEAMRLDQLRELIRPHTVDAPFPSMRLRDMFAISDHPWSRPLSRWCWKAANGCKGRSNITITAC